VRVEGVALEHHRHVALARGAEEGEELAGLDLEVDALQRDEAPVPFCD
jgi:hypothetical protein